MILEWDEQPNHDKGPCHKRRSWPDIGRTRTNHHCSRLLTNDKTCAGVSQEISVAFDEFVWITGTNRDSSAVSEVDLWLSESPAGSRSLISPAIAASDSSASEAANVGSALVVFGSEDHNFGRRILCFCCFHGLSGGDAETSQHPVLLPILCNSLSTPLES